MVTEGWSSDHGCVKSPLLDNLPPRIRLAGKSQVKKDRGGVEMSRPIDKAEDGSALNPAGAARRRLIKAAGLSAIAGLVSIDWQRPAIRLGSLSAHAGASVSGCSLEVGASASISPTGGAGGTITLALIVSGPGGTTELTSDSFFDVGTLTGTTTGAPSETLSIGFSYSTDGPGSTDGDNLYLILGATCCTNETAVGNDFIPASGTIFEIEAIPGDDGSCSVSLVS